MFNGTIGLDDFAPLPSYYAVGTEMVDEPLKLGNMYGNAGIMLLNVDAMRRTHDAIVKWAFQYEHLKAGLHFSVHGPLDQGAYNKYYQGYFDVHTEPAFNWKPYWGYHADAKLIHFHGPKPGDYLKYRRTGRIPIKELEPILSSYCVKRKGCYSYLDLWLKYNRSI